jgi:hypothetical protein
MYPERRKRESRLNSLCQKRRSLSFNNRFIDQKNGNAVSNRVHAMTVPTLEDVAVLGVRQGSFTGGAGEHVDEVTVQHNGVILYPFAVADSFAKASVR